MSANQQLGDSRNDNEHEQTLLDGRGPVVGRRQAMRIGAGAAVATVGLGASSGLGAASSGLNFDSDLVQRPRIKGSVTVASHEENFSELDYRDDNGDRVSLRDLGAVIAPRADEDTPHNPVSLSAANIRANEYTAFPRGASYDDDSDTSTDEVDVSALEASHYSTTNATNGSISVTNGDGDSLVISSSAVAAGETVKAAFDLSTVASEDATITSGMSRKFLQAVADVDSLPSGVVVEFALIDSAGSEVTATADPAGDASTESVLYNATGASQVAQARVGELESAQSVTLDDIQKLEIRIKETDASITLHGINVERESKWSFGTEEYLNADDELDTQDVEEPSGEFAITSLSTMDDALRASIEDVRYDVEIQASELPGSAVDHEFTDTSNVYDRPRRFRAVFGFDVETAYDLSWSLGDLVDDVLFPSGRYVEVGFAAGESEVPTLEDVDDDSVSLTDRTTSYKDGSIDEEITLSSSISSGTVTAVYVDYTVSESEEDSIESAGAVGAAGVQSDGWFSGAKGTLMMIGAAVAGMAAWFRRAA